MIKLEFLIYNPFGTKEFFKNLFCKEEKLSENYSYCFEILKSNPDFLACFVIDLRFNGIDHAGPKIELGALGYTIQLSIYNHYHWNYEQGRFFKHGEWEEYIKEDENE